MRISWWRAKSVCMSACDNFQRITCKFYGVFKASHSCVVLFRCVLIALRANVLLEVYYALTLLLPCPCNLGSSSISRKTISSGPTRKCFLPHWFATQRAQGSRKNSLQFAIRILGIIVDRNKRKREKCRRVHKGKVYPLWCLLLHLPSTSAQSIPTPPSPFPTFLFFLI